MNYAHVKEDLAIGRGRSRYTLPEGAYELATRPDGLQMLQPIGRYNAFLMPEEALEKLVAKGKIELV